MGFTDSLVVGITGGNGVIGRHISNLTGTEGQEIRVEHFPGDILDEEAASSWAHTTQPDILIHLAAVVSTAAVDYDPEGATLVNGVGPRKFAEAVIRTSNRRDVRFIYASTSHVYQSSKQPILEDGTVSPQNSYARSKLMGEIELRAVAAESDFLHLVVARVFSVYSEDQPESFLFSSLMSRNRSSSKSEKIFLEGCNNVRDFLHARQVAGVLVGLGTSDYQGTVNVGSGVAKTVRDFAIEQTGRQISCSPSHSPPTSLVADVSLLREILGNQEFDRLCSPQQNK